jgi:hypothetical protein
MFALGDYHSQTIAVEVLCRYTMMFRGAKVQEIIQQILPGGNLEKARTILETMNFEHFDAVSTKRMTIVQLKIQ